MPSIYAILYLVLAVFPLCHFQTSTRSRSLALNPEFVRWINTLFYLPPEGQLRYRKEYRLLTDQERGDFHRALLMLKEDRSVQPNKYDALASLHHLNTASGAHGGPNFLGWHRVYMVLVENACREKVPNVTIPYWDNTLDEGLADATRSITWSPLFLGNGNGVVENGPFRNWGTPYGLLRRNIGAERNLMTATNINNVLRRRWLWQITHPSGQDNSNLELLHNNVHVWIGEQMSRIESSSYDPAFFVHHAYVDCIWEEFRNRQRRMGINPARDFPRIVGENEQLPLVPMGLGRLLVIDGINDIFTRRIYRCQARPRCVPNTNNCGSPYLRCDWSTRRCLPLIMSRPSVNFVQPAQQPWWSRFNRRTAGQSSFNIFG
ncbi:putative tyrosinase-like protein tyr-1 [Argopecten irradians]|uniref:putative tyrosinase-like protein tyr-1 n=1 Tax=Argopecten irradians TaxID=31199 RepID=UPI00371D3AF1